MFIRETGSNINVIAVVTVKNDDNVIIEDATISGIWSGLTNDTDSKITGLVITSAMRCQSSLWKLFRFVS